MTHRPQEAFLSAACGKGKHWGCAKVSCTCFCHANVYQTITALMDAHNVECVLQLLGMPLYHDH